MRLIGWDVETYCFIPGLATPKLVVLSWDDGDERGLLLRDQAVDAMAQWLEDPRVHLVAHNTKFDLAVMARAEPKLLPLIVAAGEAGRLHDTMLREQLINIALDKFEYRAVATGEGVKNVKQTYSLAALAARHLGVDMSGDKAGPDAWRTRYNELDGVPLDEWPEAAVRYALDDATVARQLYLRQAKPQFAERGQISGPEGVQNEVEQVRASLALELMSAWGLRADGRRVDALERRLHTQVEAARGDLVAAGIMRPNKRSKTGYSKSTSTVQDLVVEAYNGKPPSTEKGNVKTDAETLRNSGDPLLTSLADLATTEKLLTSYVGTLRQAANVGVNPAYAVVKATGRTGSFEPNIQQMPRKGGVRECYVARPGRLLCSIDYDSIEMACLAQVCTDWFGNSPLGDAINAGVDPHLKFASTLLGKPYKWCEEALAGKHGSANKAMVAEHRRIAKAANFGYPGGLGGFGFAHFAAGFGVDIDTTTAKQLRQQWIDEWSMQRYFDRVEGLVGLADRTTMLQLYSERQRGGCDFKQACNTMFQGLAADGAKEALWRLLKAAYVDEADALFGSRPNAFIHDEVLLELLLDRYAVAARSASTHMVAGMRKFVPDYTVVAEPAVMLRWYKDAEPFHIDGELLPWYKVGCWAAPPTRAQLASLPWPAAVIVGPAEHEEAVRAQGHAYQVAKSLELAAFGSDVFAVHAHGEEQVALDQGAGLC